MNGPDATRPLNIATTKPVERIIRVSTEVNASIMGVKITPPPTPAITEMIATTKLMKKLINIKSIPVSPNKPSNGFDATNTSRNK
jgi:hypothetical protein